MVGTLAVRHPIIIDMSESEAQHPSSSTDAQAQVEYEDPVGPDRLRQTITTSLEDLWQQNEQLFVWLLQQRVNALLRTVPGGGKTYVRSCVEVST